MFAKAVLKIDLFNYTGAYNSLNELKEEIISSIYDADAFDDDVIEIVDIDDESLINELRKKIRVILDDECFLIFKTIATYPKYQYLFIKKINIDENVNEILSKYKNSFYIKYSPDEINNYDVNTLLLIFSSLND